MRVNEHKLEIERVYAVPLEQLWRAFVDPVLLARWWGPEGSVVDDLEYRPEVGRAYRVSLVGPDRVRYTHQGHFLAVEPTSRLVYTWQWIEGPLDPSETLVTLTFTERGPAASAVSICHERFPSASERDRHYGWQQGLARLDGVLASGSTACGGIPGA